MSIGVRNPSGRNTLHKSDNIDLFVIGNAFTSLKRNRNVSMLGFHISPNIFRLSSSFMCTVKWVLWGSGCNAQNLKSIGRIFPQGKTTWQQYLRPYHIPGSILLLCLRLSLCRPRKNFLNYFWSPQPYLWIFPWKLFQTLSCKTWSSWCAKNHRQPSKVW